MNLQLKDAVRFLSNNPRYRDDIKHFFEFGIGYVAVLILGYFLMREINLTLSETEMGKFSFVSSLITVLAPFFYIAAPQAYLRFHKEHHISKKLRSFLMPFYWIAFLLLAGIVYWETHSCFALLYALLPLFTEKTYLLRCEMKIITLNVLRCLELLIPLGLLLFCPRMKESPMEANDILLFYGLGYFAAFLFPCKLIHDDPIDVAKVVRFLVPLVFAGGLVTLLNNMPVILAKYYLGYSAAGSMGVAVRALVFLRSLITLFLMFYPMIYFREAEKKNQKIIWIYRLVMIVSVALLVILLVICAPFLYRILGASKYLEHVSLFIVLVFAEFMNFLTDVFCVFFGLEIKTWKGVLVKCFAFLILGIGVALISFSEVTLLRLALVILIASVLSSTGAIVWALHSEKRYFEKGKFVS